MNMILILVTSLSLILAATMAAVAWRLSREERRRSQARVATLAADLDFDLRTHAEISAAGVELFRSEQPGRAGSRIAAVLTIGVFAVATALALIVATSRAGQSVSEPVAAQATPLDAGLTTRSTAESVPLELTALTHERDGDGIVVRGVVEIRRPESIKTVSPPSSSCSPAMAPFWPAVGLRLPGRCSRPDPRRRSS